MCVILDLLLQITKKILSTTKYTKKFYNDDIKTVVPQ